MDKRLINSLLKVYHSPASRFANGRGLLAFHASYGLGLRKGASIVFTERDKTEIGRILKGELGIDAATTKPESWAGRSRSESLRLARDEKLSGRAVSEGRVQAKAMQGKTLRVCGGNWALPSRTDLGVDVVSVLDSEIGHDALLIVENRQAFDDIWSVRGEILCGLEGLNPLVLYRGDAQGGARADAVNALIEHASLPVHAFVDFDPAGMVIASGLPRLNHVLSPAGSILELLVSKHGITDRFIEQRAAARSALGRLEQHPLIGPVWGVILKAGKGLPQEFFISDKPEGQWRTEVGAFSETIHRHPI